MSATGLVNFSEQTCLDFHCECGWHSHWDRDFLFALQCPGCDRVWKLNCEISADIAPEGERYEEPEELRPEDSQAEKLKLHRKARGL